MRQRSKVIGTVKTSTKQEKGTITVLDGLCTLTNNSIIAVSQRPQRPVVAKSRLSVYHTFSQLDLLLSAQPRICVCIVLTMHKL